MGVTGLCAALCVTRGHSRLLDVKAVVYGGLWEFIGDLGVNLEGVRSTEDLEMGFRNVRVYD